ncbi:hypothetical protein SB761_30440, partial [Pseudomonas sp. SIMBA_064]
HIGIQAAGGIFPGFFAQVARHAAGSLGDGLVQAVEVFVELFLGEDECGGIDGGPLNALTRP